MIRTVVVELGPAVRAQSRRQGGCWSHAKQSVVSRRRDSWQRVSSAVFKSEVSLSILNVQF